eukprot:TRINITY_DN66705_c2_g15_i1.p1 TRINITY_DN66705_c2_g15~~TRINITY_DN66705_c2_g15_i1.p1  ORF type:complete len:427 (+),score=204.91 TRINITY_DN66705_c2_g15_i1:496-1776(+)
MFYAVGGAIFIVFLIYTAIRHHLGARQLVGFAIALSNTWGLTLAVLLLGYGFVELPRYLWHNGNRVVRLKREQYKAANVYAELEDARSNISQVVRVVHDLSYKISESDPLRPFYDQIEEELPLGDEDVQMPSRRRGSLLDESPLFKAIKDRDLSVATLAIVHYHAKRAVRDLFLAKSYWTETLQNVEELEELIAQERSEPPLLAEGWRYAISWRFKVQWRHRIYRVLGVLCAVMSCLLVWSEIVMGASSKISPFARIIEDVRGNDSATQFLAMLPLAYLSACAFFAMFKLRLMKYYHMHKGRRTEENSLLFNASYLLRLLAPIGYNFFGILHVERTEFQLILGKMDVVPFFGSSFTTYFPILILLFCLATLTNVYGRILKWFGAERFEYSETYSDDVIEEGKMIIRKEKRRQGPRTARGGNASLLV